MSRFAKSLAGAESLADKEPWYVFYQEHREKRSSYPTVEAPSLKLGVEEYKLRLNELSNLCDFLSKRCLFLTQPTIYSPNMNEDEQDSIWLGWVGPYESPVGYISINDLAKGMNLFNQALLDSCRETTMECFDLASKIPKTNTFFYDDMHFTEKGTNLVAESLATYFLKSRLSK